LNGISDEGNVSQGNEVGMLRPQALALNLMVSHPSQTKHSGRETMKLRQPVLLGWLEEKPDMEAKQMLKRLQATGYGDFPDKLLRTLQRRVRTWRMRIVQQLVYGTQSTGAAEKEIGRPELEKGIANVHE